MVMGLRYSFAVHHDTLLMTKKSMEKSILNISAMEEYHMKVFDGHTDIMADVVSKRKMGEENVIQNHHLHKLKSGGVTGANFVLWLDPQTSSWEDVELGMKLIHDELAAASGICHQVKVLQDFGVSINEEKIDVILGMEGLAAMGPNTERLDWLYEQGVRCAGLTWNEANALATGISGDETRGLTSEGFHAVKMMEKLGMLLDVSHLNETSFWDVTGMVTKPFMASHSNAYTLCEHPRNLKDEQLKAVKEAGGLVGLNAVADFLHPSTPDIHHYIQQIDYMVELLGIDHVALGFDFCDFLHLGQQKDPEEVHVTTSLETSMDVQKVIELLIGKGYSHEDMVKLTQDNFRRLYNHHLK